MKPSFLYQLLLVSFALIILAVGHSTYAESVSPTGTNFADEDPDDDGLTNQVESDVGTDPWNPDSDSDALRDGEDAVPTNAVMKVPAAPESQYAIVDLGNESTVGAAHGVNDAGNVLLMKDENQSVAWRLSRAGSLELIATVDQLNYTAVDGWLLQDGVVYYSEAPEPEEQYSNQILLSTTYYSKLYRYAGETSTEIGYSRKFINFNPLFVESQSVWNPPFTDEAFSQAEEFLNDLFELNSSEMSPWGPHDGDRQLEIHAASDNHQFSFNTNRHKIGWYFLQTDSSGGGLYSVSGSVFGSVTANLEMVVEAMSLSYASLLGSLANDSNSGSIGKNEGFQLENLRFNGDGAGIAKFYDFDDDGTYNPAENQVYVDDWTSVSGAQEDDSKLIDISKSGIGLGEGPYITGHGGDTSYLWCYNEGSNVRIQLSDTAEPKNGNVTGRGISDTLVIPLGGAIWRNGRVRSMSELTEGSEWSNVSVSQVSPEKNLLIGSASKNGTDHAVLLVPVEVAPDRIEVNGDFDEGIIGTTEIGTQGARDDRKNQSLKAERDSLDERIHADDIVTEDLHKGWFGVNPSTFPPEFFDGATVTIRKVPKTDPETGKEEVGAVRFYAVWDEDQEEMIDTVTDWILGTDPPNLVGTVFGSSASIPSDAQFWMEGVFPGKVTLEFRLQKGSIDVKHEQTFDVCSHRTKDEWQKVVRDEIYLDNKAQGNTVDIANYVVSNGFLSNRPYIQAVYAYYAKLFEQKNDIFLWAGLAKLAGAPVYAGLSDAQWGREGVQLASFGLIDPDILKTIQDILIQANINIFNDLAWQFTVYRTSGLCAIEYLGEKGMLNAENVAAWQMIDEGVLENNESKIRQGNQDLLEREQRIILGPTYTDLHALSVVTQGDVAWFFSVAAKNPVPGGLSFTTLVPNGDLTDFDDRWAWVTNPPQNPNQAMWKLWNDMSPASKSSWVWTDLRIRAEDFTLLPLSIK